jgi:hypothetical protein
MAEVGTGEVDVPVRRMQRWGRISPARGSRADGSGEAANVREASCSGSSPTSSSHPSLCTATKAPNGARHLPPSGWPPFRGRALVVGGMDQALSKARPGPGCRVGLVTGGVVQALFCASSPGAATWSPCLGRLLRQRHPGSLGGPGEEQWRVEMAGRATRRK